MFGVVTLGVLLSAGGGSREQAELVGYPAVHGKAPPLSVASHDAGLVFIAESTPTYTVVPVETHEDPGLSVGLN